MPIQVIGEWEFGHPAELIDMFDFSVVRAAMWWDGSAWVGIATSTWRRDINCREANYNTTARNRSGTLTRIARFAQLGYNIPDGSLASIAVRAAEQAQQFAARRYPHWNMQPADALERLLEDRISPDVFEYAGMYDG